MNLKQREMIADVAEALEELRKWRPFYQAVLLNTGDKLQARNALIYVLRMEKELEGLDDGLWPAPSKTTLSDARFSKVEVGNKRLVFIWDFRFEFLNRFLSALLAFHKNILYWVKTKLTFEKVSSKEKSDHGKDRPTMGKAA